MAEKAAEDTDAGIETNQPSTSGRELQTYEMYEVVDRLFFENGQEYLSEPLKLIDKLKEMYMDKFKACRSLHLGGVRHGDLVRMRGMVLTEDCSEVSLVSATEKTEYGREIDVCCILRDRSISPYSRRRFGHNRYKYLSFIERGMTDWYWETLIGRKPPPVAIVKDEKSRIFVKTYRKLFEDLDDDQFPELVIRQAELVYDFYGIIDIFSYCFPTLHVIHYEPVEQCNIVAQAFPEVKLSNMTKAIDLVKFAFYGTLSDKNGADCLLCYLIASRKYRVGANGLPYVYSISYGRPVIELIKLFFPKVQVIELRNGVLDRQWGFLRNRKSDCDALGVGFLQVSEGTVIIADETEMPSDGILCGEKGAENVNLIHHFARKQVVQFPADVKGSLQKVTIECDSPLIILSTRSSSWGENSFEFDDSVQLAHGLEFLQKFSAGHAKHLKQCRHALLTLRKKVDQMSVDKEVTALANEGLFADIQLLNNMKLAKMKMMRRLTFSKILACMEGKTIADKENWDRATEIAAHVTAARRKTAVKSPSNVIQ